MNTLPALLAASQKQSCIGPHPCVFCGAPASEPHAILESFTNRDLLACPDSGRICRGCVLCLEEVGTANYYTGEQYKFTKAFRRMCSWIVTVDGAIAATKAHMAYLRSVCLSPPKPPFGISLAVSGQKHVLFRGIVCHSKNSISLTLEGERIDYTPEQLQKRLDLCGRICAATGKPALTESVGLSVWHRVCERYTDGESLCEIWERVREEPLSRLAIFLCPPKEGALDEYPADRC